MIRIKKQSKYSLYPYVWGRCGVNQSTGEIDQHWI